MAEYIAVRVEQLGDEEEEQRVPFDPEFDDPDPQEEELEPVPA